MIYFILFSNDNYLLLKHQKFGVKIYCLCRFIVLIADDDEHVCAVTIINVDRLFVNIYVKARL
jgi:chorismate-pyruvate lyase